MLRKALAKICLWRPREGYDEPGEKLPKTHSRSSPQSDAATRPNCDANGKRKINPSHKELSEELFPSGDKIGIKVLYSPEKPVIDLVFIHGLNGDSYNTWLDSRSGTYWPVHLLQKDVPNARIMTFGYSADPVKRPGCVGQNDLRDHAYTLLGDLSLARKADPQRKLAFVVHGLGGLVIKKALCMSESSAETHLNQANEYTVAVAFLGTPHRGLARGTLVKGLADTLRLVYKEVNSNILHPLKRNSQVLAELEDSFATWLRKKGDRFTLTSFYEELGTVARGLVVRKDSGRISGFPKFPINSSHRDMTKFPNANNSQYTRVAGEIVRWVDDVTSSNVDFTRGFTQEEIDCLHSLSFPELDQRAAVIEPPAANTCAWIPDHKYYRKWLSQDQSLLWIKGNPGTGKSTLMKHILQDLQERQSESYKTIVPISFFFHGDGKEIQRSPLGLFRALLFQLLEQFPQQLSSMVETCTDRRQKRGQAGEKWDWSLQELKAFLETALPEILRGCGIRIVIDAIDESGKESARELVKFFQSLLSKCCSSKNGLSICFSSRHFPRLPLRHGFEICVENENHDDIKIYIRDELRDAIKQNNELKTLVEEILINSSHIFLWVRLVVARALSQNDKSYSLSYIQQKLRDTPRKMLEAYESTFQQLSGSRETWAQSLQLIQWICFTTRSLTLNELRSAMIVDWSKPLGPAVQIHDSLDFGNVNDEMIMEMRIKDLSGHLAEIKTRDGRRVVEFTQQSVYDYLLEGGLNTLDTLPHTNHTSIAWAHFRISRSCISYFAMPEVQQRIAELERDRSLMAEEKMRAIEDEFPLLRYSIGAWYWHAQVAEQGGIQQNDLPSYWQWPTPNITQNWLKLCNWAQLPFDRPDLGSTFLHTACFFGLTSTVKELVDDVFCTSIILNSVDGQKRTPLYYAANGGHSSVVRLLLVRKDIRPDPRDVCETTPLAHAATQGHLEVVKQFMRSKVGEVNSVDRYGMRPLSGASEQGHESVVRLLITHPSLNVGPNFIGPPLLYAASGGHGSIVSLLIDRYAEAASSGDLDGTEALSGAAKHGHDGVIKLLLNSRKVYIDFAKHSNMTPLIWAAERGHEKVVKLLLELEGISVNARDKYGFTALSLASAGGYLDVVQLLLHHCDIDLNSKADDEMTALRMATRSSHDRVADLLKVYGAS